MRSSAGIDVDSILVITYTERAAAELRARIRSRLAGLGRPELTRELDGAWISTIHGFCLRLLKQHPFAAGLDPRFRVLDESQAAVLRVEAFDEALAEFCAGGRPERLALLATYGSRALRRMLTGVYETLRAAGRDLELSLGDARRPGRADSPSCAAAAGGGGAEEAVQARRAARPRSAARDAARPLRVRRSRARRTTSWRGRRSSRPR